VSERFASRLGHDFGRVRVHTDARAAQSARMLGAEAYAVGNHIVFGEGHYQPETEDGEQLLAHELVHVLQQGDPGAVGESELVLARPDTHFDREAARIADNVAGAYRARSPVRTRAPSHEPVSATRIPRAPGVRVVQRRIGAAFALGGIGALFGGVIGGQIGGLTGAIIGAVIGGALGAIAGATIGPFPTYPEIVSDSDVRARGRAAWASTLAATTAASRREEGFWIRKNEATGRFEFTATVVAPTVGPLVGASVVLGARPADVNPGTSTAIYTVASFHTHTPTTFRPVGRGVGPSDADHAADRNDDVCGVVYDYLARPFSGKNIPAGHPLNAPARFWHSGPWQRQRM
jgi:hypothetical protein